MERQLITILINNCNDNIEQLGLFEGIMGNCLALYLLNKQIHCIEAERIAENMLERVSNEIYKIQSNTLDKGLSGIGWAINELLKTNCVEGDVDDILYEVDSIIYKFITDPLNQINIGNTANGLIGYLIYTVSRLENPNHMKSTFLHRLDAAMFRNVIDRIDSKCPIYANPFKTGNFRSPIFL